MITKASENLPSNKMSQPTKDETSLPSIFEEAVKVVADAESKPRGAERQRLYQRAEQLFEKTAEMVEALSLFSSNESPEDIATLNLKYLLIPAYSAKITCSAECGPNRLNTFLRAETRIKDFFKRLLDYNLCDASIEKTLNQDSSSIDTQRAPSLEAMAHNRAEKIEKFKQMKLLETRLGELERRIKSGGQVDEELLREYHLKQIRRWASEMLDTLEREVRPAIFFERGRAQGGAPAQAEVAVATSSGNTTAGGPASRLPGTLTIVKNDLQKQVFGVGYPSRATVTVDEFIGKKIADGELAFDKHKEVYANSLQRYAERPDLRREQEEESDVEREEKEEREDEGEIRRQRRWDEFKDANPRGSGNRHNMG